MGECELIYGRWRSELCDWCAQRGEPSYRGGQLWDWLYGKAVTDWSGMTNLPAEFRKSLADSWTLDAVKTVGTRGERGQARKLVGELGDGETIETVILPAPRRLTVCVSSQVGCAFQCGFCASGQSGFRRNLEAGEIVGQVMAAMREGGEKPTHVVFMGIGEPLDNYDEVLRSVRILNDEHGLKIGARRLTVSTCGIVPGIRRLAGENLQVELSVSLHAADEALRTRLMPVNGKFPLAGLLDACREYGRTTGRIITFEYAMIRGVNDSRAQAEALVKALAGIPARMNLIPLSAVEEFGERPSMPEAVRGFVQILSRAGVNVTVRDSQGAAVQAGCGQLRASRDKRAAVSAPRAAVA